MFCHIFFLLQKKQFPSQPSASSDPPPVWQEAYHISHPNKMYYDNKQTKQTTWKKPLNVPGHSDPMPLQVTNPSTPPLTSTPQTISNN